MRNCDRWRPTKYVYENGNLIASRDPKQVGVASRLVTNLVAEAYQSTLAQHARGRLIDLGCGSVPLFGAYRDFIVDNVCVDWGNTRHDAGHADLECDLTRSLPFADEEFDTVILSDVLEHIAQPELLWKEMSRILARGGKIIMSVPFYYCLHECPHDYYRYTEFALRRFVATSGLQLLELRAIGGVPEIIADIFAKNVLRVPVGGPLLANLAQSLTRVFIRTRFGRKVSDATKNEFPFEYFLIALKPT